MDKIKLFKEEVEKKPSEVTQEEWNSGRYLLSAKVADTPLPWDAEVIKEAGELVIVGGLTAGGGYDLSDAVCRITVANDIADKLYEVIDIE